MNTLKSCAYAGVLMLIGLTGCEEPQGLFRHPGDDELLAMGYDVGAEQYAMELADPGLGAVAAARRAGVDYDRTARAAAEGDKEALATLFRLTRHFSGAASEGHGQTLWRLLHRLGDAHYAGVLRNEAGSTRQSVIRLLDLAGGFEDYGGSFPLTYSLGSHL